MLRADLMPAGHRRHDRARRKRFRDNPPLVRVTPPSPATNATANLDAPSTRGSVNYMVDHICEPMPSTGSHLPNYAARCKMGERHRLQWSDIGTCLRISPSPPSYAGCPVETGASSHWLRKILRLWNCAGRSGGLFPTPPPAENTTARHDQAGQ